MVMYLSEKTVLGYVPVRENGTWKYGLKMKPVIAPSAQIHYTGNDHWLFSFQDESSSDINVVDSMIGGSRQLNTSVEMQFLQVYGRQKLNASLLKVQQQKNLVDCGVFAIFFLQNIATLSEKGCCKLNLTL